MSDSLPMIPPPAPTTTLALVIPTNADILTAWLDGRNPRTLRAYSFDIAAFARWYGATTVGRAIDDFLRLAPGGANGIALQYRCAMQDKGLATATIARRLASLRSIVALGRTLGRVNWTLEIQAPRIEKRRDTRGPDGDEWKRIWKAAKAAGDGPKARRDRALIALLHDLALRRGEVVALDLAGLDLAEGVVKVIGKGSTEPIRLTLPGPTRRAIEAWIEARGGADGPLFIRLDRGVGTNPKRLTGDGVARVLEALGRAAKLTRPLRPHGLRHAGITAALDAGCDVREVRKFSRHAKIETVLIYDDARDDVAARVARKVAGERR